MMQTYSVFCFFFTIFASNLYCLRYDEDRRLGTKTTALLLQGHSVTRKLNPDGKVDVVQTLHNLDEGLLHLFNHN